MGKFFNHCSPSRYRYSRLAWLYIHKRGWHNKWGLVSRMEQCHTRLLLLREGGGGRRWQDILIPRVFLPCLAENYESYLIYVKKTYASLPPFGPHKKIIKLTWCQNLYQLQQNAVVLSFDTPYYTELPP